MQLKRLAMDISKHVFTLHGVDEYERPLVRRNLKRAEVESFFAQLPGTEVVMEACGGAHRWGRLLTRLNHTVHLIPAQYVKPFVKRAKNDRADAEVISEAASRLGMASVPVKSAERQAELIILRHREMLLGQRTQAINALRGHATEFGVIAGKGTAHVEPLLDRLAEDTTIPAIARAMFARMGAQIAGLDRQIADLDAELLAQHKAHPVSRLLAEVPGIGPVTAITLALGIDIQAFASGRHFAA
jgi:transposase